VLVVFLCLFVCLFVVVFLDFWWEEGAGRLCGGPTDDLLSSTSCARSYLISVLCWLVVGVVVFVVVLQISQRKSGLNFKIVYRIKLFLSREEAFLSQEALNMYFIQGLYDVIMMNYPCAEKEALMLGALAVQGVYGAESASFTPGVLINKLSNFVPQDLLQRRDSAFLEAKILQELTEFVSLGRIEAKKKFLDVVKKWPIYGATFFRAQQISRISKNPAEDVLLSVSERGLIILDGKTKEVKKNYELSEILTYGYKEKSFLVVAGNLAQQKKLNFHTLQGKMINDLLLTYINKMVQEQKERQ
jgi:hypothetical protein